MLGQCLVLWLDQRVRAMSVAGVAYSHAGICPNEMNPNLWVDAMSTCLRECESDQVGVPCHNVLLYSVRNNILLF